ncbi:hypothetical protein [Paenibacillus bovis]|uniref:DUF1871 domain-containing protein n=1 Tax=Paenibacillus bovis TaxID=1616788 RepID=A0A172ZGJ1_9BACL|nr:hypothetical protein [Paenibacillus bovis]ANF96764.1 hypothetical protein AR543_12580 [Paenibacillus bovis]
MNDGHNKQTRELNYQIVALHMMQWNPMNLREWCLPDEYSIEIEHIIKVLPHVESSDELGEQLYWIMQKYFGVYAGCTVQECVKVAVGIYTDIQKQQKSPQPIAAFQFYDNQFIFGTYTNRLYKK